MVPLTWHACKYTRCINSTRGTSSNISDMDCRIFKFNLHSYKCDIFACVYTQFTDSSKVESTQNLTKAFHYNLYNLCSLLRFLYYLLIKLQVFQHSMPRFQQHIKYQQLQQSYIHFKRHFIQRTISYSYYITNFKPITSASFPASRSCSSCL